MSGQNRANSGSSRDGFSSRLQQGTAGLRDTVVRATGPRRHRGFYKGLANYYSMEVGGRRFDDIVWSYRAPTLGAEKIAGMVSFYNERVDAIFVDDEELPKRQTNRGGRRP